MLIPPPLTTPQLPSLSLSTTTTNPYSFFLSLLSQPHLTLSQTKSIHAQIFKHNLHLNVSLTLYLHTLYPSLSPSSSSSSTLFSSLLNNPSLLTFNLLIKHFSSTNPSHSLHLLSQMLSSNLFPDQFTLPPILNACVSLNSLPLILSIHAFSVKSNLYLDPFVASALINAYAKCGQSGCALGLLDELSEPDLPTYNAEYEAALRVFLRMLVAGMNPNRTTLSSVITACGRAVDQKLGRAVHGYVIKVGEEVTDDVSVNSALLFKYPRFGDLDPAEFIFRTIPESNVVSWNSVISAHVRGGNIKKAWRLFSQMLVQGFEVNEMTLSSMASVSH